MDVISVITLVILAPVLVKFIDKAYRSTKQTQLGKDLKKILQEELK